MSEAGAPAPVLPQAAAPSRSPVREAMARMARRNTAKASLALVALLALFAVYAPFVANDIALAWRDHHGWSSPLIVDLFNKLSYHHWYELVFNLLALELPILAIASVTLLRRLGWSARLQWCAAAVAASFVMCQLPIVHLGDGSWAAVWRNRASVGAFEDWKDAQSRPSAPKAAYVLIPHRFDGTYAGAVLKAPGTIDPGTGTRFWLGTDTAGHDVAAQLIFGARISLTIGLVACGISLAIGTVIGAVSGFSGGWIDIVLQRIVEIMMCFPTFILILISVAMLGPDMFVIMAVIGLTSWADTARLVRGEFLAHSVRDYVLAARSLGLGRLRIMFRHILPNALTPLIITATFGVAGAVIMESGLAFLGMGDPTVPSWGNLLEQGREGGADYGWLVYAPGLAIFLLVSALNVLGNELREALDPKGAP